MPLIVVLERLALRKPSRTHPAGQHTLQAGGILRARQRKGGRMRTLPHSKEYGKEPCRRAPHEEQKSKKRATSVRKVLQEHEFTRGHYAKGHYEKGTRFRAHLRLIEWKSHLPSASWQWQYQRRRRVPYCIRSCQVERLIVRTENDQLVKTLGFGLRSRAEEYQSCTFFRKPFPGNMLAAVTRGSASSPAPAPAPGDPRKLERSE